MSAPRIRVLIVDDSAFARKVLREVLSASADIEIVGFARDGLDALEKIAQLAPDVVTLDLMMPDLDGLGVLHALKDQGSTARVVIVTMTDSDGALAVAALQAGAFDLVHKPTAIATDRLYEMAGELLQKVRFAGWNPGKPPPAAEGGAAIVVPARAARSRLLVIGASTGGPQAITRLLRALDRDFPVPVAIVLHMPAGFTELLAKRLDEDCAIEVMEARDGLPLVPGRVVIGQAGMHLVVKAGDRGLVAGLELAPLDTPHRPAVDVLFRTAAAAVGAAALGVVLTGMGSDGLEGARAIHAAGGRLLTETEASCVVYGMPRCVDEAGLSAGTAPIDEMLALVMRNL